MSTTARSWLMNRAANPCSRWSSSNSSSTRACTETSRAEVGSSAMSSSGSSASDRARLARWRWPPESSCGKRAPNALGSWTCSSSSSTRERAGRRAVRTLVDDQGFRDGLGDGEQRVEARRRVLEDEADALAHRPERPLLDAVHLGAEHLEGAAGDLGETGDRPSDGGLAAAALPHQ